jgi:hypothetical protein
MCRKIFVSSCFFFLSLVAHAADIPDFLRQGVDATPEQIAVAVEMYNQGWRYTMPRPKSAQAAWGNSNGQTTWYNGYWKNEKTGAYSSGTPRKNEAGEYVGDGRDQSGTWRRGGSPGRPDVYMFLLSRSGGPRGAVRSDTAFEDILL